jgi:hypothetical protein
LRLRSWCALEFPSNVDTMWTPRPWPGSDLRG